MQSIVMAFALSLVAGMAATRVAIALGWRWQIVDWPDGFRKTHARATPKIGGIAVYLGFAAPLLLLLLAGGGSPLREAFLRPGTPVWGLLLGAALSLAAGLIDDIYDLRPLWKVLLQLLIASVAFAFGFRIGAVSVPLAHPLQLGLLSYPVTLFWFLGCMNAVNLMDGLDGLAAGAVLFVALTLFLVSMHFQNLIAMFLLASLSGATLGFLRFNFPPARIFLGDCGSMLLGFLVASLSLIGTSRKAEAAVALFIPIVALGLPITDTLVAIVRRWYRRLPISAPDREHIHHALVGMGYSQRRAVLSLYVISVLLGGAALLITFARSEVAVFVVGSLVLVAFVCVRVFSGVRLTDVMLKLAEDGRQRQQTAWASASVERAVAAVRGAGNLVAAWAACGESFAAMDLDLAELAVDLPQGPPVRESWARVPAPAAAAKSSDRWTLRLSLYLEGRRAGEIMAETRVDGAAGTEGVAPLLGRLRLALEEAVAREHAAGDASGTE